MINLCLTKQTTGGVMRKLLLSGAFGILALGAVSGSAAAADKPVLKAPPPPPASMWVWEVGARWWYSDARNYYDYYSTSLPAARVSALDYDNLRSNSGEIFGRVDSPIGFFLKGYIGGGKTSSGNLYDEDFPPFITPYTKTISDAKGNLSYANIDVGYSFYDGNLPGKGTPARFGLFLGYHYWHEKVDAYGCSQISTGNICAGANAIPTSVKVITEEDTWRALRFGAVLDLYLTPQLTLTAEAAYARVWQKALDIHYFTFGPDPASGHGHGLQIEAVLNYAVTNYFNVGVGARWWHYKTEAIDAFDQLLMYKTDRVGVFVQSSLKFGDPRPR
jgi:hypothetical protein